MLNKHILEEESYLIFEYLTNKYFPNKKWIIGHSLMTFIQFCVIQKHNTKRESERIKICGKVDYFNLNSILISKEIESYIRYRIKSKNSPKLYNDLKKVQIKSSKITLKEKLKLLFKVIKINIKGYKLISYEYESFSYSEEKKIKIKKKTDKNFSELIYSLFEEIVDYKMNFKLLSKLFSFLPYFSGQEIFNPLALEILQERKKTNKQIISIQHGGHNYISSPINDFLFPEYFLSNKIIISGNQNPQLRSSLKTMILKKTKYPIYQNSLEKELIFVAGQILNTSLRLDGNPLGSEWNEWNNYVSFNLKKISKIKLHLKDYPNQNYWSSQNINFKSILNRKQNLYENNFALICDHYGTTFLKSLFKGKLCLLIIDNRFNITKKIHKLISPFIYDGSNLEIWIISKLHLWNSGEMEKERIEILNSLYRNDKIF